MTLNEAKQVKAADANKEARIAKKQALGAKTCRRCGGKGTGQYWKERGHMGGRCFSCKGDGIVSKAYNALVKQASSFNAAIAEDNMSAVTKCFVQKRGPRYLIIAMVNESVPVQHPYTYVATKDAAATVAKLEATVAKIKAAGRINLSFWQNEANKKTTVVN